MARSRKVTIDKIEKLLSNLEKQSDLFLTYFDGEGIDAQSSFDDVMSSELGRQFGSISDRLSALSTAFSTQLVVTHRELRESLMRDVVMDDATFNAFLDFLKRKDSVKKRLDDDRSVTANRDHLNVSSVVESSKGGDLDASTNRQELKEKRSNDGVQVSSNQHEGRLNSNNQTAHAHHVSNEQHHASNDQHHHSNG